MRSSWQSKQKLQVPDECYLQQLRRKMLCVITAEWRIVNGQQCWGFWSEFHIRWQLWCGCGTGMMCFDAVWLKTWQTTDGETKKGKKKGWQTSIVRKIRKISYTKTCASTFLDFLRWLFLLDEFGQFFWGFHLPITRHLWYWFNTSWEKGRWNPSTW